MSNKLDPKRLAFVEALYCTGKRPREIERETAAAFGVKPRTVRNYLTRVKTKLGVAFGEQAPEAIKARSEAMLLEAYAAAKLRGDPRAMADVAMRLAELSGALSSNVNFRGNVKVEGLGDMLGAVLASDTAAAKANAAKGR